MKNNLKLDSYQNQNSSSIRTKGSSGNINGTCDYSIIQENNEKIENKKIIFDNMIKEINIHLIFLVVNILYLILNIFDIKKIYLLQYYH